MEVAITEFRSHLRDWLSQVQEGSEIVVTDRGVPVARLHRVDAAPILEVLGQRGLVAPPARPHRPTASGRARPRSRRPVSRIISEQRR